MDRGLNQHKVVRAKSPPCMVGYIISFLGFISTDFAQIWMCARVVDAGVSAVRSALNSKVCRGQFAPREIDVRTEWIAARCARSWIRVVRNSFVSRRKLNGFRSNLDVGARGRYGRESGTVVV